MLLLLTALLVATAPVDTIRVNDSHWRVYDSQGNPSSLEAIVSASAGAEALLIGETHDDPVVHHLQLRLLQQVFAAQHARGVALSMEMFCRDVQYIVDEYLDGQISESAFLAASSPWPNYATDYRPLVEFAKAHNLSVVAANAPRRYVSRVTRLGPESLNALSERAKASLAPLPYARASEVYEAKWNALMEESMAGMVAARRTADSTEAAAGRAPMTAPASPPMPAARPTTAPAMPAARPTTAPAMPAARPTTAPAMPAARPTTAPAMPAAVSSAPAAPAAAPSGPAHGGMSFMLDSQSLWDATMAFSVAEHLLRNPGSFVVHVVGAFHVESYTGIPEHLTRYRPGTGQVVVSVRPAADVTVFERDKHAGLGDFVILADESLPRTHQR